MGRKKPNFDNWALEDSIFGREDLTALEKLVALAIFQHRNHNTGDCHPSSPVLAKRTGLSKTTVLKYVERIESKDVCTVDRKPGRGGNWYYALFDDAERAEPFRNSKREPVIKCHQTEKEIEMPKTTQIDPALVDLVAEIKYWGITNSSDLKDDLVEIVKKMRGTGFRFSFIALKFNEAGIPRLRGGDKPWTDQDIRQMVKIATKEPVKPPPPETPAPVKHRCYGCDKYWDEREMCRENNYLVERLTECPLGKWEADGGPF